MKRAAILNVHCFGFAYAMKLVNEYQHVNARWLSSSVSSTELGEMDELLHLFWPSREVGALLFLTPGATMQRDAAFLMRGLNWLRSVWRGLCARGSVCASRQLASILLVPKQHVFAHPSNIQPKDTSLGLTAQAASSIPESGVEHTSGSS